MSWDDVVGHETPIRLLRGRLSAGRLAHAILLVGPEGIGKRTLAMTLAGALVGTEVTDAPPQRVGGQGKGDSHPGHPDICHVRTESDARQIGIEQVRELERWFSISPYGGQWKVGILEEADCLTEEAAHASLKLLEELAGRCLLVLTATVVQRLPQTFISRCYVVRCRPQGIGQVDELLCQREKLPAAQARMLAIASGGRLGLALRLHREGGLEQKNAVLSQLLNAYRQGELEIPLSSASRAELLEVLEWWAAWWRDLLVLALGGNPDWVIHQDRIDDLRRYLAQSPPFSSMDYGLSTINSVEALLSRLQQTYRVQEAVRQNVSLRMALGALLSHR